MIQTEKIHKHTCPIFVISLESATGRHEYIKDQMAARGLDYTIFPAIDGRGFDVNAHPAYHGVRRRRNFGKDLSGGELGCLLSHRGIFEKMVAEGIERAFIFEDDVIIPPEFPDVLQDVLSCALPYDVVRFMGHEKVKTMTQRNIMAVSPSCTLKRLMPATGGAYAYLITLSGARKMLRVMKHNWIPVDILMGHAWRTGLNAYIVMPGLITHRDDFESQIGEARFEKKKKSLSYAATRFLYKISEGVMKRLAYLALWPYDCFTAAFKQATLSRK